MNNKPATTETAVKPLVNATARLLPTTEINAMQSAIEAEGGIFSVKRDSETLRVIHVRSNRVVMDALAKGPRGPWIARIHPNLFL